ncbi:VrrA/YqfQ family protein [Oceanobacillus jeddahense]|uniref:VrrA/YqfQ family protein n=1 Tax=Oceanobacillus jeddahense TaxID=1462527 RepID=UPI000595D662|nr:VrrA/YqfQ family protein [Oceanobacillus jeddahense]
MVFPRRNQMPRSPQPPFRNGNHDLRGIPREIRNTSGVANTKGESRGLASLLSGGATQGLAQTGGVSTLSKTLGGVQQVLGVVQSTAPLIQEYGPMVKNLPSMYRMMKAFKTFSKEDNDEPTETEEKSNPPKRPHSNIEINKQTEEIKEEPKQQIKEKGVSTPKLYI